MYRIAPRVSVLADKVNLTVEVFYTVAAYGIGSSDEYGIYENSEDLSSLRLLVSVKYSF